MLLQQSSKIEQLDKRMQFDISDGTSISISNLCFIDITINGVVYPQVPFFLLKDFAQKLCLGQDFLQRHESLTIAYGGEEPVLKLSFL